MSFIPCSYPCKFQKDGYCLKTHICPPSKFQNPYCAFFEPQEPFGQKKEIKEKGF